MMRGRMVSNCGWALEYIDALDLIEVQELSAYWAIEPPANWLLKALTGYKEEGGGEMQDERLFTQTVASKPKPFDELPLHIQRVIIERSGLTEVEFHRQRIALRKESLLKCQKIS